MKRMLFLFALLCASVSFAQVQTYKVSSELCSLTFDVSAQLHQVHGTSNAFSGIITGDPADITGAKIQISLDPKTFDTDNHSRDKVMREKSLEVDKHPSIEFTSVSIESATKELVVGKATDATIKGTLKLHGMEKEMTVPVKILLEGNKLTADAGMALVLDEWKILRPRVVFFRLQNDINIHFKIVAVKEP
jgi:polyisoprenoid-binding protein YceI